jgi:methyl-accepting chemotaxis protein
MNTSLSPLPGNSNPMLERRSSIKVWRQLLGRWVLYELSSITMVVPIWSLFFGLADWRVMLGLTVIRVAGNYLVLGSGVTAYFRWAAGPDAVGDPELLAIDRALQETSRRFAITNTIGWVLVAVLATTAGSLGLTIQLTAGNAELLFGGLMMVAVACGQWVTAGLFEPVLLGPRAAVGEHLIARRINSQRQSRSIVTSITSLNVMFVVAVFYGMLALCGMAAVEGWRSTALAQQQLRAEHGAIAVEASGELEAGLAIIESSALPSSLQPSTGEHATLLALDERNGLALAAAPLADGRWVFAQAQTDGRLWQVVAAGLLLPLGFLFTFVMANRSVVGALARQLDELRDATQQVLTAGNIRGIKRLIPPSNDEVGRLVLDFNGMLDVLDELAEGAHTVANGDLTVEFERPGELHDAFRGMLAQLRGIVTQIRSTALELASAASEIHAVSQEQERVVDAQSRGVGEVGSTVELLANAAEDIARTSTQVLSNAEKTLSNTDATVGCISELNAQVGSITQLLEVIREVADRSDLLALNGSLEATRAGEAGRGFALVAAEMRRLAERVAGSVADVRGRMTSISSAGTSTVIASAQSRDLAERTAAAARQISSVTTTQHHDTQRVAASMHEVAQSVAASAAATSQTRAAAEGLRLQADELERLTRHFRID